MQINYSSCLENFIQDLNSEKQKSLEAVCALNKWQSATKMFVKNSKGCSYCHIIQLQFRKCFDKKKKLGPGSYYHCCLKLYTACEHNYSDFYIYMQVSSILLENWPFYNLYFVTFLALKSLLYFYRLLCTLLMKETSLKCSDTSFSHICVTFLA